MALESNISKLNVAIPAWLGGNDLVVRQLRWSWWHLWALSLPCSTFMPYEFIGSSCAPLGHLVERCWKKCLAIEGTWSANRLGFRWRTHHGTLQKWPEDWKDDARWVPWSNRCFRRIPVLFAAWSPLYATVLEGSTGQYLQLPQFKGWSPLQPVTSQGFGDIHVAGWESAAGQRMPRTRDVPKCDHWSTLRHEGEGSLGAKAAQSRQQVWNLPCWWSLRLWVWLWG